MEPALFRTGSGSIPIHNSLAPGFHPLRISLPVTDSIPAVFSALSTPKTSRHKDIIRRTIRRCSSESDVNRLEMSKTRAKIGTRSFSEPITISEDHDWKGNWSGRSISCDDLGFSGGGMNNNRASGGSGRGGGGGYENNGGLGDRSSSNIGDYCQQMLKTDPTNSLILRNYAKYLYEVERDVVKAEEYYGRAILANPGDGEVLALYGKLIWETHRDENRAKCYFQQALQASPHDCSVLGSYAYFLWEAEGEHDEEEEEEKEMKLAGIEQVVVVSSATVAVVEAF